MAKKKQPEAEIDTNAEEVVLAGAEEIKSLVPVNVAETFGVVVSGRSYVVLYERTLYEEDTTIVRGEQSHTYYAGQYGPWKLSSRPYPATLKQALGYVLEWLTNDNLAERGDMGYLIEAIDAAKEDIMSAVAASPLGKKG